MFTLDPLPQPSRPNADTNAGDRILGQQSRFNRSTSTHWEHFASHRREIEGLLDADRYTGVGRLCVLGAGNCNDLDLRRLLAAFAEVHLVDLDGAALSAALDRQGVEAAGGIHLHPSVDLTGVAPTLATWPGRAVAAKEIAACLQQIERAARPAIGEAFDVVLSPCVLSQICGLADDTLGRPHPRTADVRAAIRRRHLRLMVDLLAPGGAGVLVCDMASSEQIPDLPTLKRADLPDTLRRAAGRHRCFAGLDPASLTAAFRTDSLIAPLIGSLVQTPPWTWRLGPEKMFLVYALRLRKSERVVLATPPSNAAWS